MYVGLINIYGFAYFVFINLVLSGKKKGKRLSIGCTKHFSTNRKSYSSSIRFIL